MQSVVGQFSRLWQTRKNTQILLVNPVNTPGAGGGTPLPGTNPPTWIVQREEDMLLRQFEMPLVNYQPPLGQHDVGGNGLSTNGYLCPLNGECVGGNINIQRHNMVVSNQLRDCFYVANQQNGVFTLGDITIDNSGHEPINFFSQPYSSATYPEPGQPYWGWTESSPGDDLMTAEDIMRHMPPLESCPFSWPALGNATSMNMDPGCSKPPEDPTPPPNAPPVGVWGDVVSFLRFVNGTQGAYPPPGYMDLKGLPQIVPIANPEVFDPDPLTSHVILFLSKRLNPAEIPLIQNEVDTMIANGRILVVVYMPNNQGDWDDGNVIRDQLRSAFRADPNAGDPNILYTLVPNKGSLGSCGVSVWQCFRDYWENELLTPNITDATVIGEQIVTLLLQQEAVF